MQMKKRFSGEDESRSSVKKPTEENRLFDVHLFCSSYVIGIAFVYFVSLKNLIVSVAGFLFTGWT